MNDDCFKNLFELLNYLKDTEKKSLPLLKIIFNNRFEVYHGKVEISPVFFPPFTVQVRDSTSEYTYLLSDVHRSPGEVNDIEIMVLYCMNTKEWFYIDHPIYKEVN